MPVTDTTLSLLIMLPSILVIAADSPVGAHAISLRAFTDKKFAQEGFADAAPIISQGSAPPRLAGGVKAAAKTAAPPRDGNGARKRSLDAGVPVLTPDQLAAADKLAAAADDALAAGIDSKDVMLAMKNCMQLLQSLKHEQNVSFFSVPVDPVRLQLDQSSLQSFPTKSQHDVATSSVHIWLIAGGTQVA